MDQFIKDIDEEIARVRKLRSNINSYSELAIKMVKQELDLERIRLKAKENYYDFIKLIHN